MGSPIVNFYNERSMFITGGTGFVGKVLIEKLLRSCAGIKHIFILMRAKKTMTPADRLNELIRSQLFNNLRVEQPDFGAKLVCVEGDVALPGMGLSASDTERLCREVSIVFHSAATVRFDEPLKQSININVIGTHNVIELCRKMHYVAAIVHVSTAYANCDKRTIEERCYPIEESPRKIMKLAEWMSHDMLQALKKELLRKRPNTYTYTKALAEAYLANEAQDMPVIICRPSIVVATWREPVRGWIDNLNGPTGVVLGVGKGLVRSMYCKRICNADIIPVDIVINLMVTLAWHVGRTRAPYRSPLAISNVVPMKEAGNRSHQMEHNRRFVDERSPMKVDYITSNHNMEKNNNNNNENSHNNNNNDDTENNHNHYESNGVEYNKFNGIKHDDGYDSSHVATPELIKESDDTDDDAILCPSPRLSKTMCSRDNGEIEVFHCTSGSIKPISWGQINEYVVNSCRLYPSGQMLRWPNGEFEGNHFKDLMHKILLHRLPAHALDLVSRINGKRPILVKIFEKFDKAAAVLEPFTTNDWLFRNNKMSTLSGLMSPEDRKQFDFDMSALHWPTFFDNYILGVRKHLLNEDHSTLTDARRNMTFVYYRNLILQIFMMGLFSALVVAPLLGLYN